MTVVLSTIRLLRTSNVTTSPLTGKAAFIHICYAYKGVGTRNVLGRNCVTYFAVISYTTSAQGYIHLVIFDAFLLHFLCEEKDNRRTGRPLIPQLNINIKNLLKVKSLLQSTCTPNKKSKYYLAYYIDQYVLRARRFLNIETVVAVTPFSGVDYSTH